MFDGTTWLIVLIVGGMVLLYLNRHRLGIGGQNRHFARRQYIEAYDWPPGSSRS